MGAVHRHARRVACATSPSRRRSPILTVPAQRFWDADFLLANAPGLVVRDDRPDAPNGNVFYAGDAGQVGFFIHGYKSAWLPATLLQPGGQQSLADAIFAATRHWRFALHFNKGLAGASTAETEAARDTAMQSGCPRRLRARHHRRRRTAGLSRESPVMSRT